MLHYIVKGGEGGMGWWKMTCLLVWLVLVFIMSFAWVVGIWDLAGAEGRLVAYELDVWENKRVMPIASVAGLKSARNMSAR